MNHHLVMLAIRSRLLPVVAVLGCVVTARSDIAAAEPAHASAYRYPISIDGKWGYINAQGEVVIQPTFWLATPFSEGLALVYLKEGYTEARYVDASGRIVLTPPVKHSLTKETAFSEGFAKGHDGTGREWHFDRRGKLLAQGEYFWRNVDPFSNGLAAVDVGNQKTGLDMVPDQTWGFIDRSGRLVIPCRYFAVKRFSNGLAPVCVNQPYGLEKSKWGFINKKGQMVVAAEFDDAWPFSEGLALVQVFRDEELNERKGNVVYRYAYINADGQQVIPFREYGRRQANSFQEGLAAIGGLDGGWHSTPVFIDRRGDVVVSVEDDVVTCDGFSGGHACARHKNGRYGYLDPEGKWAIPAEFDRAEEFVGPLARVGIGREFGYIDHSGKRIWWSANDTDFRRDEQNGGSRDSG